MLAFIHHTWWPDTRVREMNISCPAQVFHFIPRLNIIFIFIISLSLLLLLSLYFNRFGRLARTSLIYRCKLHPLDTLICIRSPSVSELKMHWISSIEESDRRPFNGSPWPCIQVGRRIKDPLRERWIWINASLKPVLIWRRCARHKENPRRVTAAPVRVCCNL